MKNEIEVMRVVRVPPLGKLVVEAGKRRFARLEDLHNEKLEQMLLAAIGELVAFAGGYEALVEAGLAPPVAPTPFAAGTAGERSLEERQQEFLSALERDLRVTKGESIAGDALPPGIIQEEAPGPPPSLNLVEEIDAILQRQVATSPELASRSIHLQQPPGGSLQINVDGKVYDHPQEVDDPEVRRVIRLALKEWESR
jgi:hypothetical protein